MDEAPAAAAGAGQHGPLAHPGCFGLVQDALLAIAVQYEALAL
jgi:hypothetical protein